MSLPGMPISNVLEVKSFVMAPVCLAATSQAEPCTRCYRAPWSPLEDAGILASPP